MSDVLTAVRDKNTEMVQGLWVWEVVYALWDPSGGEVYGSFFHSTNMYSGAGNAASKRVFRSRGADILREQDRRQTLNIPISQFHSPPQR